MENCLSGQRQCYYCEMKKAVIIGAGPAGLTAAYELVKRTDIKPVVLEKDSLVGGISKTVNYKGNRIDIGGHRFFTKSDRVMTWWQNILPINTEGTEDITINYHNKNSQIKPQNTGKGEKVFLVRNRKSRIYFLRKFFDYPISLSINTLKGLGVLKTLSIAWSYLIIRIKPIKPEITLEDFFVNRFGKTLYETFFKDYTEKVWGVSPSKISRDWGAQRIKGVSITKVFKDAFVKMIKKDTTLEQKNTETSLIEKFLYPRFGPGQLWEEVAEQVKSAGGTLETNCKVVKVHAKNNFIHSVDIENTQDGTIKNFHGDYFFSTMAIKDLVNALDLKPPKEVRAVANGLIYRNFITVGLLIKNLSDSGKQKLYEQSKLVNDTWLYIQERDVKVGRVQIFNNWSPSMVKDPVNTTWIGMEYFCDENDDFWKTSDEELMGLAKTEISKISLVGKENIIDSVVIKMEKTYPAYFGTYNQLEVIKKYINNFENLFLIGRNGMHKYNNQDHSMLTAMIAVDNIISGTKSKDNLWEVNTEGDYHEKKTA